MKIQLNKKLLPIKAHFFFFFAALGPILPQLNVFGRQLGVSPAAMGMVTAVLPLLWALAKPLFGYVVDFWPAQRKLIFMLLIATMSGSYCCLWFLPMPEIEPHTPVTESVYQLNDTIYLKTYDKNSIKNDKIILDKFTCHWNCTQNDVDMSISNMSMLDISISNMSMSNLTYFDVYLSNMTVVNTVYVDGAVTNVSCSLLHMELDDVREGEFICLPKEECNLLCFEEELRRRRDLDNVLKSSTDNALKINKDDALKSIKDDALKLTKDDALKLTKDDALNSTKDNEPKTNEDGTLKSSKNDLLKSDNDNVLNINKDDALKIAKDDTLKSIKDNALKSAKDDALKSNKDDELKITKDDELKSTKDYAQKTDKLEIIKANNIESTVELKSGNFYMTAPFWAFVVLMCVGTVAFNVANCIGDAVCFDVLGDEGSKYGVQRAWGTAGYGLTALAGGWLIDLVSGHDYKNFTPAFIIVIVATVVDLYSCRRLHLPSLSSPSDSGAALCEVLRIPRVVVFIVFAVVAGTFDSFIIYYMFWFLEEIAEETGDTGKIKLIEGVVVAAQSFIGEILFFFYSGKIINRLGYGTTLTLSLFCYGVRMSLISLIHDPWHLVYIEGIMQGPTYALCYSTIVGYAAAVAPEGYSATVQGIVAGVDDGLGFAIGSLVGGQLYSYFGGRGAFRVFAVVACVGAMLHGVLFKLVTRGKSKQKEIQEIEEDEKMLPENHQVVYRDTVEPIKDDR